MSAVRRKRRSPEQIVAQLREWHHLGRGWPAGSEGDEQGRTRFLAVSGIVSSALFSLIILAQAITGFFISPCWD